MVRHFLRVACDHCYGLPAIKGGGAIPGLAEGGGLAEVAAAGIGIFGSMEPATMDALIDQLLECVTSIATAMGAPAVAAIETAGVTLSASLTAFAKETNGSLTVSYDNTSSKTRIDTLLADLNSAAVALRAGLVAAQKTVTSGVINTAITTFNALLTVIDAFEGMLGISLTSVTTTQEATALSTLGAK